MIELLAAFSVSAAAGIRIALPLLVIRVLQGNNFWSQVPILSHISPPILLSFIITWSLVELFASKKLLGQRVLQLVELLFSPLVGAIMGLGVANATLAPNWLIAIIGGLLAFIFQLIQIGWFFRLRGLPLWAVFLQDALCIVLVLFAFKAPSQAGLITLLMLWFAVYSAKQWYGWYHQSKSKK